MGSPCEIRIEPDPGVSPGEVESAIDAALVEVERLEARYSRYREESFLSRINRAAQAGEPIALDDETAGLLDYAATCHRESGGLFDVTSGILRRVWRFPEGRLPGRQEIDALLDRVGFEKLRWQRPVLSFAVPGVELDFGGIVKEYAADRVAGLLQAAGMPHALVNLGGDVRVAGSRADGGPWQIGIRHPRRADELLRSVALTEGALSTSGDYERCIEIDGRRHAHVLDPRTGWPVEFMASASVVAPLCVVAGSASTIAMLKGREGPDWLARLGLPALWVDVDGRSGGSLARTGAARD